MLEKLVESLRKAPVVKKGEYDYFVHGISDGVPAMDPAVLKEIAKVIDEILDLLIIWYRDVLYYKATQDTERLIFKQDIYEIKKQSVEFSYRGLENIFVAIQNARVRLQANVNFDLTLENLLMTLKENVE